MANLFRVTPELQQNRALQDKIVSLIKETLQETRQEWNDVRTGSNTIDTSQGDNYANLIGRLLGSKYPNGDCNELIQKYIKKTL